MNTTVNREYSDTLNHFTQVVNDQLVEFAHKFYGESLTPQIQQELCALDFMDKVWLLEQYKEELASPTVLPDLSNIY